MNATIMTTPKHPAQAFVWEPGELGVIRKVLCSGIGIVGANRNGLSSGFGGGGSDLVRSAGVLTGQPQCGQADAWVDTSFPHSWHLMSAIISSVSNGC